MKQKALVYSVFNRIWHWGQAFLVLALAVTGLVVHYPEIGLMQWESAVEWHRIFAWSFVILIAFAMFWHMTSGQWKQFVPTTRMLPEMIAYYVGGIFRGDKKPVHKTTREKLNPLQRLTYTGLLILVIPVLVGTGFLYLYFNELSADGWGVSLDFVATIHTLGAFLMVAFLLAHIYMTTTGDTLTSNIAAMITGHEDLNEEGDEDDG